MDSFTHKLRASYCDLRNQNNPAHRLSIFHTLKIVLRGMATIDNHFKTEYFEKWIGAGDAIFG